MKTLIFSISCLMFSINLLAQTIIKVSLEPGVGDYTSIQEAIDAATPGSTIMIMQGGYSGNVVLNKSLQLIGAGYNLIDNFSDIQTDLGMAYITGEFLVSGSGSMSIIKSIRIGHLNIDGASSVTIKRCWLNASTIKDGTGITIQNCYVSGGNLVTSYVDFYTNFRVTGSTTLSVKSCLFADPFSYGGGNTVYMSSIWVSCTNGMILIDQCIFHKQVGTQNNPNTATITVTNSIGISSNSYLTGVQNQSNNFISIDPNSYFVGFPTQGAYTFDSKYQLKSTAPAKNAATHGGDCGIFGGIEPYKLSGLPDIPLIYELNVPNSGTNGGGINVNIKARSEN